MSDNAQCPNIEIESSASSLYDILRNYVKTQSSTPCEDFVDDVFAFSINDSTQMISAKRVHIDACVEASTGICVNDLNGDDIIEDYGRISLAYENLRAIPRRIAEKFSTEINFLDLSHNNFQNLSFLSYFDELHTLILDRNSHLDVNSLPYLPHLKILWINNCDITNVTDWIHRIKTMCPSLEHLSLMGNPGLHNTFRYCTLPMYNFIIQQPQHQIPPSLVTDCQDYILQVLPDLKYLNGVSLDRISDTDSESNGLRTASPSSLGNASTTHSNSASEQSSFHRKNSPTLSFKDIFRFKRRKKSYQSSSRI